MYFDMVAAATTTTEQTGTRNSEQQQTSSPTTTVSVDSNKTLRNSSVSESFFVGATSGAISCVLFQPLDLIKTRLQTSTTFPKIDGRCSTAATHRPVGIFTAIYNVIHKESPMALWKGLTPSLYRTVPGVGMYFCTLQFLKGFWRRETHFYENLFLGFTARGLVGATLLPVTVIKARFESGRFHYKTVPEGLRIVWKLEGLKGLFSGFTATLARDAPFSGLYLMFYNQGKHMNRLVRREDGGVTVNFACGVAAGVLASIVTHPADVVKTQLQLYPSRYVSTKQCTVLIYHTYGMMGFFRGVLPRCLRRTLISAFSWTFFEEFMKRLGITI